MERKWAWGTPSPPPKTLSCSGFFSLAASHTFSTIKNLVDVSVTPQISFFLWIIISGAPGLQNCDMLRVHNVHRQQKYKQILSADKEWENTSLKLYLSWFQCLDSSIISGWETDLDRTKECVCVIQECGDVLHPIPVLILQEVASGLNIHPCYSSSSWITTHTHTQSIPQQPQTGCSAWLDLQFFTHSRKWKNIFLLLYPFLITVMNSNFLLSQQWPFVPPSVSFFHSASTLNNPESHVLTNQSAHSSNNLTNGNAETWSKGRSFGFKSCILTVNYFLLYFRVGWCYFLFTFFLLLVFVLCFNVCLLSTFLQWWFGVDGKWIEQLKPDEQSHCVKTTPLMLKYSHFELVTKLGWWRFLIEILSLTWISSLLWCNKSEPNKLELFFLI